MLACHSRRMKQLSCFYKCALWATALASLLSLPIVTPSSAQSGGDHTFGNPNVWRWPPSRAYHIENYKLVLHFDGPKGEVFGEETITLRPFERHFQKFYLDSTELTIEAVTLLSAQGTPVKLAYETRDSRLWVTLDRVYGTTSVLQVRIAYHGFPRTGLFFVNPTPEYPQWPHEVYSQGEPEFNHFWFPCWDYPNDMSTSETITTVPEGQMVVSNGRLAGVQQAGGIVTYDWVESVPHSSYLISLAIGPWRKVSDRYKNTPVDYYVPDTVDEETARRSFHLTPDMIAFFSQATGVEYPYEQYAQTTVQNYIFGGQENVSATTLTDMTLHDERADRDYPSTDLVSHELGQHWFGDFVQGRDWANIWLNEGFATYLEALYAQHHEGYDAYRVAIYQDQIAEQMEDHTSYRRPIVDRHYEDPLEMFDLTTHQKGAAVLDMLRFVLDGSDAALRPASQDETFFRVLHQYLTTHNGQAVDTADLAESLRTATGRELGWFFHEWLFLSGHPDYRVEAAYDLTKKIEKLKVTQTQQIDQSTPVFDMPIAIAFYGANGESKEVTVRDNLQQQVFEIPIEFEPQWVAFDPNDFIDKTLEFDQPMAALIAEARKDPSMMSRLWATQQLGKAASPDADARTDALVHVLSTDAFYAVRAAAATGLGNIGSSTAKRALLSSLQQSDSRVRTAAIAALARFSKDPVVYRSLVNALRQDSSYAVEAAAAQDLGHSAVPQAFDVLQAEVQANPEFNVMQATLGALAATKDPRAVPILIACARPGQPERIRMRALAGLASFDHAAVQDHQKELLEVTAAALHDSFYPVQAAGEQLVAGFQMFQFEADIKTEAERAPMAMQRELARTVLHRLHRPN